MTDRRSMLAASAALLAAARATPEKVGFGSAGAGSTHHLGGELMARMAKAPLLHVPYRGDSASLTGLLVPAGTPRAIVDRLNAETHKALQEPAVRQKLADIGGEARDTTPDEIKAMIVAENEKWTRLVAEANIPRE